MNNLDIIKKACVAVNPNIEIRCNGGSPCACETIQLADVLYALPLQIEVRHEPTHLFIRRTFGMEKEPTEWIAWNLLTTLEGQSEEVLEFIAKLLS